MDFKKLRKSADRGLRKALHVVSPTMKVVKEATNILATVAKPTPVTVTNAVVSGLTTLSDLVAMPDEIPEWVWPSYIPPGLWSQALQAAGFRLEVKDSKKGATTKYFWGDDYVQVDPAGNLRFLVDPRPVMLPLLIKTVSQHVPAAVSLFPPERDGDMLHIKPLQLTSLVPTQTAEVLARTLALLGERRAILLEGRPGVGKTTMAQAIAKTAGLGRVVMMSNQFLSRWNANGDALRMLDPGVIIVDDIDKVKVSLDRFEVLRSSCRLLICTANNGAHDSVIDGALARPARLDEIFTIAGNPPFRHPPFDTLPDAVWDIVSQWPQAYLNELELRLRHTPNDLRLEDLEKRLERRTASVAGLISLNHAVMADGVVTMPYDAYAPLQRQTAKVPIGDRLAEHQNIKGYVDRPDDDYDPT